MTINNTELTANLKSCSAIFIEKLIVSFGDEAIKELEKVSTLGDKRDLLAQLILESEDDTIPEMMCESIKEFAEFVVKNEASLKVSKEAVTTARATYNTDKENYKTQTQVKVDALDEEFDIDQDKLAAYQLKLNKVKAAQLRKKTRHRGLVAIAKGSIAATIDGIESSYFKTVNAVVSSAIADTKVSMRNFTDAGVDVDTIEGTKAVEEAVISKARKTSADTDAGKNDSIISHNSTEAAKKAFMLGYDLNSESIKRLEDQYRQEHTTQIQELMTGE